MPDVRDLSLITAQDFRDRVKCEKGWYLAVLFLLAFYVWGYCVMRVSNMITHYSNMEEGEVVCVSCNNGTLRLSLQIAYLPMMRCESNFHDLRMFEVYGHPSPKQWIVRKFGFAS